MSVVLLYLNKDVICNSKKNLNCGQNSKCDDCIKNHEKLHTKPYCRRKRIKFSPVIWLIMGTFAGSLLAIALRLNFSAFAAIGSVLGLILGAIYNLKFENKS